MWFTMFLLFLSFLFSMFWTIKHLQNKIGKWCLFQPPAHTAALSGVSSLLWPTEELLAAHTGESVDGHSLNEPIRRQNATACVIWTAGIWSERTETRTERTVSRRVYAERHEEKVRQGGPVTEAASVSPEPSDLYVYDMWLLIYDNRIHNAPFINQSCGCCTELEVT